MTKERGFSGVPMKTFPQVHLREGNKKYGKKKDTKKKKGKEESYIINDSPIGRPFIF